MSFLHTLLRIHARLFPLHRRTVRLMESLYKRGYITGEVNSVTNFGAKVLLDLTQFVQRYIYFAGAFDINVLSLMNALNRECHFQVMLDVGANIGHHSLFGALKLNIPRIIAFEPDENTYNRLKKNVSLNGLESVIKIGNYAVSDTECYVSLEKPEKDNDGMNYIVEASSKSDEKLVKTVVLDQVCAEDNIDRIDLLKIDVEGAEAKVLRGAINLLNQGLVRVVLIEICDAHLQRFGDNSKEVVETLEKNGFSGFVIDGWKLKRLNITNIPSYCDAVFVKDELFNKMKQISHEAGFTIQ